MRNTIICTLFLLLLLPLAIVGGMERRYQALDAELDATVQRYERFLDSVIQDAADMEREIAEHRFYRSRPLQDDMTTDEFLEIMADYLAKDGRCRVRIERNIIDWSTWRDVYK